jgi:hypothetical protein
MNMEDSACFTSIHTNSLQMPERYRSLLLLQILVLVKLLNPGRSCIQNASILSVKMFCLLYGDCKVLSIVCPGDDHHKRPIPPEQLMYNMLTSNIIVPTSSRGCWTQSMFLS